MPEDSELSFWQPLLWCVLLLMLIVSIHEVLRMRFRSRQRTRAIEDPSRILSRRSFAQQTHRDVRHQYASQQHLAYTGSLPSAIELESSYRVLQDNVLVGRHEFHARHIVPDQLLRRAVMDVLRGGNDEQARLLRVLFQSFNANHLVNIWDDVVHRVNNHQGNWYQALGRNRSSDLRRGLDNVTGQLFLSESQGNLFTGTHIDITDETLGLLGRDRVQDIVNAAVELIDSMGLRPQLALVQNEVLLSYDGASGEYRQYGYNPRRSRDAHIDPLAVTSWSNAATIWSNTNRTTILWYCARYQTRVFFGALILLFLGLYALVNWAAITRRFLS
jgi:hypothetical protein